jgi:hypothetical protein
LSEIIEEAEVLTNQFHSSSINQKLKYDAIVIEN